MSRGYDSTVRMLPREFNGNLTTVYLGRKVTLFFSYETVVAYAVSGEGTFKSENVWSLTTGKHLKSIPAHEIPHDQFEARVEKLFSTLGEAVDNSV